MRHAVLAEPARPFLLDRGDDRERGADLVPPSIGEADEHDAAVGSGRVGAPLEVATFLEVVDERRDENGAIYVAEGGLGGDVCSAATRCLGTTSQVSRVDPKTGAHRAVVTGRYSRSVANEGVTGVDGLAADGSSRR